MMLIIFICMTLALGFCWFGYTKPALFFAFLCLAIGIKEFLWEIHSPEYGYSMPWIQL